MEVIPLNFSWLHYVYYSNLLIHINTVTQNKNEKILIFIPIPFLPKQGKRGGADTKKNAINTNKNSKYTYTKTHIGFSGRLWPHGRRHHLRGEGGWGVCAIELLLDEPHGQGKLL